MTKRKVASALAVLVLLCATLPSQAGDAGKEVKLTGWITDEWCGAKNASAEGKKCTLDCNKKGAALVLYADGKTYKLSDQKAATEHVGYEVTVQGTLAEDGSVKVTSIQEAKKKA